MRHVIVLAGPKGAGKTFLAEAISKAASLPRVSFGNAVRETARSKGLPTDTETLQNLGQTIVQQNPVLLCEHVLAQAKSGDDAGLVIDGLRHKEVFVTLKRLCAPRPVVLVFIDIAADEQVRRIAMRDGIDAAGVQRMNLHQVEAQLPEIRAMADLIVDGVDSPQGNALRVISTLGGPSVLGAAERGQ
jgi:cytidylate kinase